MRTQKNGPVAEPETPPVASPPPPGPEAGNGSVPQSQRELTLEEQAALDLAEQEMNALRVTRTAASAKFAAMTIPISAVKSIRSNELFRTHPDPEAVQNVWCCTDEVQRGVNFYPVYPDMVEYMRAIKARIELCDFYLTITTDGVLRWLVVPQGIDGSDNEWHTSRAHCAVLARKAWIRMFADMENGRYMPFDPREFGVMPNLPEPVWPQESPAQLFLKAFKESGRLVDNPDHPLPRKLIGRSGVAS